MHAPDNTTIHATVLLGGLSVTGVVNLFPGGPHEHGTSGTESAKIRITGHINGLTAGQYVLHIDPSIDLGNVAAGGDGAANVNLTSTLIALSGPLSVIGRTLSVYAGNSSNGTRVAWGIILLAV